MIKSIFLVALLAVASHSTDFDQGKFDGIGPPLLPREKAEAAMLPKGVKGLEIATTHTRLQTYLLNNAALKEMSGLLLDAQMTQLAPELQKRLRAEGAALTQERDGMLPDAANLDQEDTGLVIRRDELNADRARLDARLTEINRQAAEHEAACLPTHPPERHDWCVANARRLNGIIGRYNADVKVHNAAIEQWKRDVASIQPRWDAFVRKILAWEELVKKQIEVIKAAFARLVDCEYIGGHSEIIRVDPLESKITCTYTCCGRFTENYRFIKGKPTQSEIDFICTNPMPRCVPSPAIQK